MTPAHMRIIHHALERADWPAIYAHFETSGMVPAAPGDMPTHHATVGETKERPCVSCETFLPQIWLNSDDGLTLKSGPSSHGGTP